MVPTNLLSTGDGKLKLSISQDEINELLGMNFGAESKIENGKLEISAMMGMIKLTLEEPTVPAALNKPLDFNISTSLSVKMFLGKIKQELKNRKLDKAIQIDQSKFSINLNEFGENQFVNWLKSKTLRQLSFKDGEISIVFGRQSVN